MRIVFTIGLLCLAFADLPAQHPTGIFDEFGVQACFLLCPVNEPAAGIASGTGASGTVAGGERASSDTCRIFNAERCRRPFIPASTFKILNSLIALEHDVIGLDDTLRWDGVQRQIQSWNQDQCMRDAFQRSCVWFYQELARRIGQRRMRAAVEAAGYGNRDIGGGIDRFWLDGALRITPEQQIAFLRRLWNDDLPFSPDAQRTVKELMLLEKTPGYTLRGKTGTAIRGEGLVGWLVGYIQRGDRVYAFALNIETLEGRDLSGFWTMRMKLTKRLLEEYGLI